jgi:GT2 family glycosyltransferase
MTMHVITPVHNRAAVSERFARALAGQRCRDFQLVLVDDGCTDDTVARIRAAIGDERLTMLRGAGDLWWAGALQLAYRHLLACGLADGDAVLICNDDVEFDDDFLHQGHAVLAQHPDACIQALGRDTASGCDDHGAVVDVERLDFRGARPGEAPNCLSTRGLLMSARTFERSGGFRPRWLPHYLSDYEFTLRLRRQGVPLIVSDRFQARVRFDLTGIDAPTGSSARALWRQSFSRRAKFNPLHWSAFIVMACPARVVPGQLARLWLRFGSSLLRASRRSAGAAR